MVAPVIALEDITTPISETDIRVTLDKMDYLVPVDLMAAIRMTSIEPEPLYDLREYHDSFTRAVDLIFSGF